MKKHCFPWLASGLVVAGAFGVLGAKALSDWPRLSLPCIFKSLTGLPCATCGLTRCGLALVQGDWRLAFHWHPVAVLFLLLAPILMVWDLRRAWQGEPFPDLPDSLAVRMVAAGLFLATWALQVVRNI